VAALTAPPAQAAAASITFTPAQQTITSGGSATWQIRSASTNGKVILDFGDGTSVTHAAGSFTFSHRFAICSSRAKREYLNFVVQNGKGSITRVGDVTVKYAGPLCS
jgi:hypothetical protein